MFKLTANLLLKLDNSHVYSQQNVVNCAKEKFRANFYSFINFRTIRIMAAF